MAIKRILAPTDGAPPSETAVRFAVDIALAEGAEVVVLGVVHSTEYGEQAQFDPLVDAQRQAQGWVDGQVGRFSDSGVTIRGLTAVGATIEDTILSTAEEIDADVIIMGTQGRSRLARATIGSVADRVVRHSRIPVILVPLV